MMTVGIKYISYANSSGYGLAAVAYLRGLHNAGVPVWWQPSFLGSPADTTWRPEHGLPQLPLARAAAGGDSALADLPALAHGLTRKIPYDTVIMHTVPEHWPRLAEPGKRNIGYTVWETDALPRHWPPLLATADKVLVPCAMNVSIFSQGGVANVSAVPHIRRHAWNTVTADEKMSLRRTLGIPDDHFVFYTIGVWDPRKAIVDLVALFARQFSGSDKVTLLIKTSATPSSFAIDAQPGASIPALVRAIVDAAQAATNRSAASIALLAADDISGRTIDVLHSVGDCYISLTHGEGWGLGAYEAATLGKPIIITGWGGQLDYLGADYPGLIDYSMQPVSGWRPDASYQATQRWAIADGQRAGQLMRRMVARYMDQLDAATLTRERIINRFAEPIVTRQLLAAIHG